MLLLDLGLATVKDNVVTARSPTCYVIAGPNGAGKTTFAMWYLPRIASCRIFINADMIAQGLSPLDIHRAEPEAGRILLRRIDESIMRRLDFAIETTLAGRGYARLFHRLRASGFAIIVFYLWIPSAAFSLARIASRVERGGHDVPTEAVVRRYLRSLRNLFGLYMPLSDRVLIFDNSSEMATLVADLEADSERIANRGLYASIRGQIEERENEQD